MQAFEDSTQRESSGFEHVQRQRQRQRKLAITISQMTDQENMITANEFFEIKDATITKEENATIIKERRLLYKK